jgi:acyl transferase domain-containing protein
MIRKPILFQGAIQTIEKEQEHVYLDLGPSGTLSTFAQKNISARSRSRSFMTLTPFGQDVANLEMVEYEARNAFCCV